MARARRKSRKQKFLVTASRSLGDLYLRNAHTAGETPPTPRAPKADRKKGPMSYYLFGFGRGGGVGRGLGVGIGRAVLLLIVP